MSQEVEITFGKTNRLHVHTEHVENMNYLKKIQHHIEENNDKITNLLISGFFETEEHVSSKEMLKTLAHLNNLKNLEISLFSFTGEATTNLIVEIIKNNKSLETIAIEHSKIDSLDIKIIMMALKTLKDINTIQFSQNTFTDNDGNLHYLFQLLPRIKSLKVFKLCNNSCNYEENFLLPLTTITSNIKTLCISDLKLSTDSVKYICEFLQKNTSVTELDLTATELGYKGIDQLTELMTDRVMKTLKIGNNYTGNDPEELKKYSISIFNLMKQVKYLDTLDISETFEFDFDFACLEGHDDNVDDVLAITKIKNLIFDEIDFPSGEMIETLSISLGKNETLEGFSWVNEYDDSEGGLAFIYFLECSKELKSLRLSTNLEDQEESNIYASLTNFESLTHVELTRFCPTDGDELVKFILSTNLKYFKIGDFSELEDLEPVLDALETNHSLVEFGVHDENLGEEEDSHRDAFKFYLERNKMYCNGIDLVFKFKTVETSFNNINFKFKSQKRKFDDL